MPETATAEVTEQLNEVIQPVLLPTRMGKESFRCVRCQHDHGGLTVGYSTLGRLHNLPDHAIPRSTNNFPADEDLLSLTLSLAWITIHYDTLR